MVTWVSAHTENATVPTLILMMMRKRKGGGVLLWLQPQEDSGRLAVFYLDSLSLPPPLVLQAHPPQALCQVLACAHPTMTPPTAQKMRTHQQWCCRLVCLLTGASSNHLNHLLLQGLNSTPLLPKPLLFRVSKEALLTMSPTASPSRGRNPWAPAPDQTRNLWRNPSCFQMTLHLFQDLRCLHLWEAGQCGDGLETLHRWAFRFFQHKILNGNKSHQNKLSLFGQYVLFLTEAWPKRQGPKAFLQGHRTGKGHYEGWRLCRVSLRWASKPPICRSNWEPLGILDV